MAQFDVFLNTASRRGPTMFFVSLQSTRYETGQFLFVAPLCSLTASPTSTQWLAPTFTIKGQRVVLDVFNLATLSITRLGTPIATLADEDSRTKLVRALDEFLSQA